MKAWIKRVAVGFIFLGLTISAWSLLAMPDQTSVPRSTADLMTPIEHVRGVEQTFLTYPEWFLVFSPAEYAAFMQHDSPSNFPFMGHIGQFWSSYKAVVNKSRSMEHDLNPGYHLMIMVIGTSTTLEYTLRALYENTFGALSQATADAPTAEDQFAAKVAQDYVDFIRVLPWYEYSFWHQLKSLWSELPMIGPNKLRKWERRFALSLEYGIKTVYGQLIKLGTKVVYEPALLVTAIQVKPLPSLGAQWPDITTLATAPDGLALVTVPRYDAFLHYAQALAEKGGDFKEIAGNRSVILVSLIGEMGWQADNGIDEILFDQPILTQPGRKRVVVTASVPSLAQSLRDWKAQGIQVEHIFDY